MGHSIFSLGMQITWRIEKRTNQEARAMILVRSKYLRCGLLCENRIPSVRSVGHPNVYLLLERDTKCMNVYSAVSEAILK